MSTVLKQVPDTGGWQSPRQLSSIARQVACRSPIAAAHCFMQPWSTEPSLPTHVAAHDFPAARASAKHIRALMPQSAAQEVESGAVLGASACGQAVLQSDRVARHIARDECRAPRQAALHGESFGAHPCRHASRSSRVCTVQTRSPAAHPVRHWSPAARVDDMTMARRPAATSTPRSEIELMTPSFL
jgi:hypothetical protein